MRTFEGLAQFFRDWLDWPVSEWRTFEGVPQLYGLDRQAVPGVERLAAVQKLNESQKWGVFLVDFGQTAMRRSDLRRILNAVAERARQTHDNPTWPHEDILFVVRHSGSSWALGHFRGDKLANAKLKTFGWSEGSVTRTTLKNLQGLRWGADWAEAFDVEAVTKEFFKEASDLFFQAVEAVRGAFPTENEARLFVQTLFNRLMFLRFVEAKGWLTLNGREDYLRALWEAGKDGVNPLWPTRLNALFGAVNHPTSDNVHAVSRPIIGEVPFLNGGLFDDDPSFARPEVQPPPAFFDGLLGHEGLLYRYNVTVEESSPMDVQVAIDPEILGKIFEQLTVSSKRHDTGSYYTPREIVQFMCREALVGYLISPRLSGGEGEGGDGSGAPSPVHGGGGGGWGQGLSEEKARKLVYDHDDSTLTNQEGNLAFEALKAIKVVDPACGSGAYLLGMLQELYALFEKLRRDDRKFSDDPAKEAHERKLWIIENNLYGVDLQAFATNTAMLRLWLTLLVEDTGAKPQPLPNLEYKIETGDSLLGPDPSQPIDWSKVQRGLDFEGVHETVDALRKLREKYQDAHGPEKLTVKKELEAKLAELREKVTGRPTKDPAKFDWRVEFFDVFLDDPAQREAGFDVALANPPYVRADAPGDGWKAFRKALKDSNMYVTLHEKWDLYIPFLERAHRMLAPKGSMVFIIPDAYNTAKYAAKSHEFFVANSTIERIDFCSEIPLFNAGVFNTILHFSRQAAQANHIPKRVKRRGESPEDFERLGESLDSAPQAALGARVFRSDIQTVTVSAAVIPLCEVCYISVGMVIHADEKRAHLAFKATDLISNTQDSMHPKRFFRGKDMERWRTPTPSYLEWGTSRAPQLFRRPTFPELYEVPEKLISMDLAGGRPRVIYDNQQLFHNHSAWSFVPWHLLEGVRNASIRKTARYRGEPGRGAARMSQPREELEEVSQRFEVKYLLGVMNSEPGARWMNAHRKNKMHIFPDDWREFPIPRASDADRDAIAALVQKCLDAKAADPTADVSAYEAEIDEIVERLYFGEGQAL
ncbi:MAG: Eco57I restriction-modification methylase domain-containing protein [Fimbriimonadaceae bacterium]|nr:Eco57I restriction-modification methylase domain-containing protein [Fimbriimonadaceae bacterium]QYK57862.1 MAG: Eco57I restriction-modification methylase domain-containing protein [Fimbriimonadaceae bacterium]